MFWRVARFLFLFVLAALRALFAGFLVSCLSSALDWADSQVLYLEARLVDVVIEATKIAIEHHCVKYFHLLLRCSLGIMFLTEVLRSLSVFSEVRTIYW